MWHPLILACIAGISFDLLGLDLPFGLESTLEILARAALPLGLLAVGAGLEPSTLVAFVTMPLILSLVEAPILRVSSSTDAGMT